MGFNVWTTCISCRYMLYAEKRQYGQGIKNFLNTNNDILMFFKHLGRLVQDQRCEELKADFTLTQNTPKLKFNLGILKHAARMYTPAIFKMFQDEVLQTWNCDMHFFGDTGSNSTCKLKINEKIQEHTGIYDSSNGYVECSCKNFEFVGILCTHALKVLDFKNIRTIPDCYLMKRWTNDAKAVGLVGTCVPYLDRKVLLRRRYKELCRIFVQVAAKAAETEETYAVAAGQVSKLLQEVQKRLRKKSKPNVVGDNAELKGLEVELGQTVDTFVSRREQLQARKLKGLKHFADIKKRKIRPPPQNYVGATEENASEIRLKKDLCNPTSDPRREISRIPWEEKIHTIILVLARTLKLQMHTCGLICCSLLLLVPTLTLLQTVFSSKLSKLILSLIVFIKFIIQALLFLSANKGT